MQTLYPTVLEHVRRCAALDAITTPALFAHISGCPLDAARNVLRQAAEAHYLRSVLHPAGSQRTAYQPMPKAASLHAAHAPKAIRAGLPPAARERALLRANTAFIVRPDLAWLPASEQSVLCRRYGIAERGYARALVGLEGAHYHVYVPVLPAESPYLAVENAANRWLHLLESGSGTLHFIAPAGTSADGLREVLTGLNPAAALQAELARLDGMMAADRTGTAAIQHARRRAELVTALAAEDGRFPWLGTVVEVTL